MHPNPIALFICIVQTHSNVGCKFAVFVSNYNVSYENIFCIITAVFFVILLCIICLYTSLHLWVLIGGVILVDKYINYIIPWYEPFITCLYSAYKCKIGGLKEVLPLIRLKTPPSKHLCSSFSLLRFISVSWEKCEGGPVFFNPQPPPPEEQCLRCDMFSLPPPPPPVLKSVPFTARTAKRGSRFFCEANLCDDANC